MLPSTLGLNEGTAMSSSCSRCFPGLRDQHYAPEKKQNSLLTVDLHQTYSRLSSLHPEVHRGKLAELTK